MADAQLLWNSILSEAQKRVRKQQFDTWFSNIDFVGLHEKTLRLSVPNTFFRDWLRNHYSKVIEESAKTVTGSDVEIKFSLSNNDPAKEEDPPGAAPAHVGGGSAVYVPVASSPVRSNFSFPASNGSLPLHSQYVFDNFVVGPCNNLAHAAALAVAATPSQAYNPLFMHGSVGLGKTHLVQAIAHALLTKHPRPKILYMS